MYNRMRLGEILMERGALDEAALSQALQLQRERGGRIGEVLVDMEAVPDRAVVEALSLQLDYPFEEELPADDVDMSLIDDFELGFSRENRVLPLRREHGRVVVATHDPLDTETLDEVRLVFGVELMPVLVPLAPLLEAINEAFDRKNRALGADLGELEEAESPAAEEGSLDINDLLDASADDEAPVIRFVNSLFIQAVRERASDIHIEPGEKDLTVRFRVDGVLKEVADPPKRFQSSIVTRLKIMAGLNIAEKRLPQDGRIRVKIAGKDIDVRVATAPSVHDERVTMRLLDKSAVLLDVRDIGIPEGDIPELLKTIHRPHGIVLVTGPTGSGKTTTLYSCLSEINSPDKNILTVEDPVEYQLDGISQMQVKPKINLTFASGLRSYLRHDPDVIMVGEIRDLETAEMAIQASLTGHLVFSTLHTNDAAGAFTRLSDMGVEPFLISSSVIMTMAQRLVRRLCTHCRQPYRPTPEELSEINLTPHDLDERTPQGIVYRPAEGGCDQCNNLGYSGRTGIYEFLHVNEDVRRLVMNQADTSTIKQEAQKHGMNSLRGDGALKVLRGITSIEEVMRVATQDEVLD